MEFFFDCTKTTFWVVQKKCSRTIAACRLPQICKSKRALSSWRNWLHHCQSQCSESTWWMLGKNLMSLGCNTFIIVNFSQITEINFNFSWTRNTPRLFCDGAPTSPPDMNWDAKRNKPINRQLQNYTKNGVKCFAGRSGTTGVYHVPISHVIFIFAIEVW